MNKIKSFEEACEKLCRSTALPDVSSFPENMQKSMIALYKLTVIIEVVNDGCKPNWNDYGQRKWYPFFCLDYTGSGLACVVSDGGWADAHAIVGSRLCLTSEEAACHVGETFLDLWTDWLL